MIRVRSKASLYEEIDHLRREVERWKRIADCTEKWCLAEVRYRRERAVESWRESRPTTPDPGKAQT